MSDPTPLLSLRVGTTRYNSFVIVEGWPRWIGRMAPSLLADVNAAMFDLARQGHGEGFVWEQGEEGSEVEPWVDHMADRAGLKEAE